MAKDKVIAVVGPTASGKTALAVRLALTLDGELVSADSRQVYRGMDIGSGKEVDPLRAPDRRAVPRVLGVPQHLIDIVDPDESFSVADWQTRAFAAIEDILSRGKVPILVGGTGLYVKAVVDRLTFAGTPPDAPLRRRLQGKTVAELFWELRDLDPDAAARVDRHNKRRLIRAIEVARAASAGEGGPKKVWPYYDVLQIGIEHPREELYRRIDSRVDEQFARGLVEEVRTLVKRYGRDLPALSGIGHRELIDLVGVDHDQPLQLANASQRIKYDTHAYARRQLTWFRKDRRIRWVKDGEEALFVARRFLRG